MLWHVLTCDGKLQNLMACPAIKSKGEKNERLVALTESQNFLEAS